MDAVLSRLEQDLATLREQVVRLQRLAALGTASAMLAHEFRNILTPVMNYAQAALTGNEPLAWRAALERTVASTHRLVHLSGRILGMAAPAAESGADVSSVAEAVDGAIDCLGRPLSRDGIDVHVELPDACAVRIGPLDLQHVLFNLFLNAREAMLGRPGRLTVAARREGPRVRIDVADTGRGVAPEHLARLFEPFFSTRREEPSGGRRGAGLGLHLCRRIVEQAGGEIRATSTPGEGSVFTIVLPAADRSTQQPRPR